MIEVMMEYRKPNSHESPSPGTDTAVRVIELVREVYRSAAAVAAEIGKASGIHATDADALRLLDAAAGRPTMTELGAQVGLSPAAVTALVDRLEHAKLARRVRDPSDRRRIRVELTQTAQQLAATNLQPIMDRIRRTVDDTPPDELHVVARFLTRLTEESTTPH